MTTEAERGRQILLSYRKLWRLVEVKRERLRALMESATRITPQLSGDRVSGGGAGRRTEEIVVRRVDLERQLESSIMELEAMSARIERAVNAVPDLDQRTLLEMRYLSGASWPRIRAFLAIAEATSYRLQRAALASFAAEFEKLDSP